MSVAFVLSGGGSLGAVQVGMLRALYERGIRPDLFVGTSVGAINAAFLASRPQTVEAVDHLAEVWTSVRRADIFPLRPVAGFVGFFGQRNFLVPPGPVHRLLMRVLELDRIEQAAVPLHLVATDVYSGREVLLSRGPLVQAVMASIALPGVFPPVEWEGTRLMDGGVSNNAPISHACQLGADVVYVLPAGAACEVRDLPQGAVGMVLHAISLLLMRRLLIEIELLRHHRAELVVIPPPCPLGVQPIDFSHAHELIAAGEEAAHEHLAAVAAGLEPAPIFGIRRRHAAEHRVGTSAHS